MSLDVYLWTDKIGGGLSRREKVMVREDGRILAITREEWHRRYPDRGEPMTVPPDDGPAPFFTANITHNLAHLAREAGIYEIVWRSPENGITRAEHLLGPLSAGLARLKADEGYFRALSIPNGWGSFDAFITFLEEYLAACRDAPEARVDVWR